MQCLHAHAALSDPYKASAEETWVLKNSCDCKGGRLSPQKKHDTHSLRMLRPGKPRWGGMDLKGNLLQTQLGPAVERLEKGYPVCSV